MVSYLDWESISRNKCRVLGLQGTVTEENFIFGSGISATAGDFGETLVGTSEPDILAGGEGPDRLVGYDSADLLTGGDGADTIEGGDGKDVVRGGEGDDTLFGGLGNDLIEGGIGDDFIVGGDGDDRLKGDAGDDTIDSGDGADTIDGGAGDDVVLGGLGNDILVGGLGDDMMLGGAGEDTAIFAGAFADHRIDGFGIPTPAGSDSTGFDGSVFRVVEDLVGDGGRDSLVAVELLQFDDGILDARTGEFDDGAAIATAEPEPLVTAPATSRRRAPADARGGVARRKGPCLPFRLRRSGAQLCGRPAGEA